MVKTGGYLVDYWEEGCGGGSIGSKTVLGVGQGEGADLGEEESLQHLDGRTEEGDRAVTIGL